MPATHDHHARELRHRQILTLLRRARVSSQQELAERLRERGIETTQPSLSRDLRELGVRKLAGRYVAPGVASGGAGGAAGASATTNSAGAAPEITRFVRDLRPAGPHLLVVITATGAAQAVGIALDRTGWPELVGTLAGDDTVFVATASARDQLRVRQRLAAMTAVEAGGGALVAGN